MGYIGIIGYMFQGPDSGNSLSLDELAWPNTAPQQIETVRNEVDVAHIASFFYHRVHSSFTPCFDRFIACVRNLSPVSMWKEDLHRAVCRAGWVQLDALRARSEKLFWVPLGKA